MLRKRLLKLSRRMKRSLQVVADLLLIWTALWLAFIVRLGFEPRIDPLGEYFWLFLAAPLVSIPIFIRLGLYRAVLRYFDNDALKTIFKAISLSALLLALVIYWYRPTVLVPRSLVFNYWWLSLIMIGGLRLLMRQYFMGGWLSVRQQLPFMQRPDGLLKVAVYGAGAAGNQLVAALRAGRVMQAVAFIDDDDGIATRVIAGLKVYKPKHIQQLIEETGAQEILLAIPSVSRARRREILEFLEVFPLHVRSVPGYMDLATGRVKVEDIQEVDVADLLGRDSVAPRRDLFERCIDGQSVMVTGAGGSIGSELCRQVLNGKPVNLILFDHGEYNLYSIHAELLARVKRESLVVRLVPVLGSIRNVHRLTELMQLWNVDTVYHAAAYKHVPLVEHNIAEGLLNNVFGTLNAAQASITSGVKNFVLISTDKAVRPTNVMGGTKRLAEMVLQALSHESEPIVFNGDSTARISHTRFTMVRFGNVLGSSGSVIPLFHEQIRNGGPVTVTHPNITRYFMTIPEAAQLVIQAGALGQGGDVFVLDMGSPVKIAELAEKMVHLSGLSVRSESNPQGDIAIEFSGLRPGEKLYEELLIGDNVSPTEHPMIMRANEEHLSWRLFKLRLSEFLDAVECDDYVRVRKLLRETVSGYEPEGEIVDWIHVERSAGP